MKLVWLEIKRQKEKIVLVICGLLLLFQFANLVTFVSLNMGSQAVIAARDDDSGAGIAKAVKTRWWKDNGWAHYGPAYFRAAHTLHYFLYRTAGPAGEREHENWERTAHFSIMVISLFSVFMVCGIVSSLLTASWPHRLALTSMFTALALSDVTWAHLVLKAHPDHLFGLFSCLAFLVTVKWLERREDRLLFVGSAMLWGIVGATKLSLALSGPGFLFLFFPPFRKERLKEGGKYLWYMFLGYFLIGFPQSIVLDRPVRFMLTQNKLSVSPDWGSVRAWLDIFWAQSWKLVLAALLVTLFMPPAKRLYRLSRETWWRLFALFFCPIVVLLPRKILVPWEHYAIPVVGTGLVLLALAYARVKRLRLSSSLWTVTIPFVVMFGTVGATPTSMNNDLHADLVCRNEDSAFYEKMVELGTKDGRFWLDPYVPYDTTLQDGKQQVGWFKTWDEAKEKGVTGFAFNTEYEKRYTTPDSPSLYTKTENSHWQATKEFYESFAGKEEVTSPYGVHFKKVYTDTCEHEIWKKTDQ